MKSPLAAPAVPDSTAVDTVAFDALPAARWRRRIRIAAWVTLAVVALVALITAGMQLLTLPGPLALALGVTLAFALALLAAGVLLIVLAVRGR